MVVFVAHFGSNLIANYIISAMLIHQYKRLTKIDLSTDDTQGKYIAISAAIGVSVSCPILWESWECLIEPVRNDGFKSFCTIILLSLSISIFVVVNRYTTILLKSMVKDADLQATRTLNMQRKTNTTRIEATNVLGYMLIVAWVPYGISKLLKFVAWEYHIHMTMTRICHFISVTTYVCIPTIYLKMDRKFEKFVKSFLSKRTSDVNDKGIQ